MDAIEFVAWCDETRTRLVLAERRDFYERIERDRIDRYERLDFHLIIHCVGGRGRHQVDFIDVDLRPGRALYIQPGQVHRLSTGADGDYEAHYIAFAAAPTAPGPAAVGANLVDIDDDRQARLDLLYDLGRSRSLDRSAVTSTTEDAALRDLLFVAFGFADLERTTAATATHHPSWATEPFDALREDIERHLVAGETIQDRAARLGYSTRTLDRACQVITGTTAKRLCDDRIALEARRLLALPNASSTSVAGRLGFSEPSNFTKFMKRTTGQTPSALLAA